MKQVSFLGEGDGLWPFFHLASRNIGQAVLEFLLGIFKQRSDSIIVIKVF